MASLPPPYVRPYLIWVSQQGSQSDPLKIPDRLCYFSSSNTPTTSELFQSKGPNLCEDVQNLWRFCSVLLSSLSLLTPALPPSFQFPHKLIHSEPLYLFILVVRMPFLKYLYREDISLFSGVHCHQYHLFSRIPWSLNSVCFLIFLYPLSFVWLSLELLIF